ncbi:MAG: YraN family protein [Holosporaceae bacterium]|jgi:putative endonuclease|nr:YraN family protein [Holosporaceae bacterium]
MNSTERKGYLGEFIAVLLLRIKGYRILARRYKTVCGEIDIVAQRRDVVAFVEVKSRKSLEKCCDAINAKQMGRIRRTSEIFLSKNPRLSSCFIRYDVILTPRRRLPRHLENVSM